MNQPFNRGKLFTGLLSAMTLATLMISNDVSAALGQLTSQKQVGVREGQVVVAGTKGQYTGKMIVRSTKAIAWAVLTDYDNYEKFLPDVEESRVIENNGNNKVFEQIKVIQAAIFTRKSPIRIAVSETYPNKISFKMTSGEIQSLQGSWTIQPLSVASEDQPIQLLITHQVTVDPGNKSWRGIFYGIYEDSLEDTLQAIKTEINRRSSMMK
ncbi:cyclase/dehydrase [Aphanothece hegewaldii CCALA 016]|uniref:Cyclase/dehydrase n=1 Tax=Aphanothece hegewaldii CCALA 016 TaxID=2107694 RepID=A0A2T1LVS3_9CHRO|nr:SRPBCC family protein [Aphanothece hegewaldii]PSF35719.1 cyclase/dehydrase [Aphanothece hegewaldii CCALA 016]